MNQNTATFINNSNPLFVEDLYQKYQTDPSSVDIQWQKFFDGYEYAQEDGNQISNKELYVSKLIQAYRSRGHLIASTNPIRERRTHKSDLQLDYFGLSESDLDKEFECGNEIGIGKASLRQILDHLKKTYCSHIGVEFTYCRDEKLRQWLYENMECNGNKPIYSNDKKIHIHQKICDSVIFESFLHTKYVGKKRFSLEGLETFIPALDTLIHRGADLGVKEFVLGMAHRGRLNVLVNIFQKSAKDVFSEFEEKTLPGDKYEGGDVKYHLGKSADIKTESGKDVHLSIVSNPSHLEAVNPVVEGIVYGKQLERYNADQNAIVPILVHGDAAFSGQGVNYEVINGSKLDGFNTGGTIHVVLNNQVGFTANYKESRSSVYCTDLAKVVESPVFHVNADDPEAVVHVMELAIQIRQLFNIDVYIDILGYRRYGHNEGDEPRFTQPILYKAISKHSGVLDIYTQQLISEKVITEEQSKTAVATLKASLQESLNYTKDKNYHYNPDFLAGNWKGLKQGTKSDFEKSINTGVKKTDLDTVMNALVTTPDGFNVFSKTKKLFESRKKNYFENKQVDWAVAELLAYGSLLNEQHPVRLVGQDSQRGTFSHRHALIKDEINETEYTPLNNINDKQAHLQVYNSFLSEYSCMGFEYGYSLANPNTLVLWEAQFGDFSNGAQIMIDQFVSSSEAKWFRMSGLVLLLPHGYEGQGPEHSSARPERYLQLCAQENMIVANVTTPANYFHLLRRQLKNKFRKPLVVFSPKSLFRHPKVISDVTELTKGNFKEIIDTNKSATGIKRVLICTGKIYYDLLAYQEENKIKNIAIVRLEQLYPLPEKQINELFKKYKSVKDILWVQEEPENMGFWAHINRFLHSYGIRNLSRKASATPATGNSKVHQRIQNQLIEDAFNLKRSNKEAN